MRIYMYRTLVIMQDIDLELVKEILNNSTEHKSKSGEPYYILNNDYNND